MGVCGRSSHLLGGCRGVDRESPRPGHFPSPTCCLGLPQCPPTHPHSHTRCGDPNRHAEGLASWGNLRVSPFPTQAPACPPSLVTVPLELGRHVMTTRQQPPSDCAPPCARQALGAAFRPTGEGPGAEHRAGRRPRQGPGARLLSPGKHSRALELSPLICKVGVIESDCVTLKS